MGYLGRVLGLILMLCAAGDGWCDFRGPTADGHAGADCAIPRSWSEENNVVWKTAVHGKGWSTPLVRDERVWLTTATEDGHKLSVLALDLKTGAVLHDRLLFEVEEPGRWGNTLNSYASPSPALEQGRVYVHFGAYGTACLDTGSGEVLWQRRDIHCDHLEGPGSSPILYEDLLIFHMDGADEQFVIALNKTDGTTAWRFDRTVALDHLPPDLRKAFSTPIVVEVDGRREMISSGAEATVALDPKTGEALWSVAHRGFSMSSRPVAGDGLVFLNTGFMKPQLWAVRPGVLSKDVERVAWKARRSIPSMSSPLLFDGRLYLVSDGGIATCLDAGSGAELWRERLDGEYSASPVLVDGRLYFCSRDGLTSVIRPGETFELLGENRLDAGFMASPAVVGDALILRTKTHVYRIEQR